MTDAADTLSTALLAEMTRAATVRQCEIVWRIR